MILVYQFFQIKLEIVFELFSWNQIKSLVLCAIGSQMEHFMSWTILLN